MAVQTVQIAPMRLLVAQGHSRSLAWRLGQLERLRLLLTGHEEQLMGALAAIWANRNSRPTSKFQSCGMS